MKKIIFIANVDCGQGMSGGSQIYFELMKRFGNSFQLFFFGSQGTINRLKEENIKNITYVQTDDHDNPDLHSFGGVFIHSIRRLIRGIQSIYENSKIIDDADYVYSVSDFLPDVIPALFAKWKNLKIKWVSAFYFFAPKPWQKHNPYATSIMRRTMGICYWFIQSLVYLVIKKCADLVVTCNELDRKIFIRDGFSEKNIISIYGGVDLNIINAVPAPKKNLYDAVFMARFHPQKGPMVAVKAWEELIKTFPKAQLAMIGNGSEEKEVASYIKKKGLSNNIRLFGFVDGTEKYKLLKSSRIFIHSATYETGGMAVAEGMACGLPVVAFAQEGFKYCYPQGLLGVLPIGNYHKLASSIGDLLVDDKKYAILKKEALELVAREWDWNKRASFVLEKMSEV